MFQIIFITVNNVKKKKLKIKQDWQRLDDFAILSYGSKRNRVADELQLTKAVRVMEALHVS